MAFIDGSHHSNHLRQPLSLQPAIRQGQRCMQLLLDALTLDGLDWALPRPCAPQGLEGSTPWRTCYKVARSKQGITADVLKYSYS